MSYPGQSDIRVVYDGNDITNLVQSVTWSGDIMKAGRDLSVSLMNTVNGRTKRIKFEHGKRVTFYNKDEKLFTGVIFEFNVDSKGFQTVTAHDEVVYLTKNTDTRKFVKQTASYIFKRLCTDFGVPFGQIENTGYVIPKLILENKTLWDMVITALTETRKQNSRKFVIKSDPNGKLELLERKKQVRKWVLENGVNLIDARYSQSIEDTRTKVKVIGGDPDKTPIIARVSDNGLAAKIGTMMHTENADSEMTKAQIEQMAKELLKQLAVINDEATVEALGINDVTAGCSIYVKESMTGIIGGYYVITDSHHFENGQHTMSITLSATDDLPELEYTPPAEPKEDSSSRGNSNPVKSSVGFIRPAAGTITSKFGQRSGGMHYGVDIAQGGTVPIMAAASGKVSNSYTSKSYGEVIFIEHTINGQTYETVYAHMRSGSRKYSRGDTVKQGATIGYMGNTGDSDGQHLHFEIHKGRWNASKSNAVDPLKYIN